MGGGGCGREWDSNKTSWVASLVLTLTQLTQGRGLSFGARGSGGALGGSESEAGEGLMVNIDLAESGERDGDRGSGKAGVELANNWIFQLPV